MKLSPTTKLVCKLVFISVTYIAVRIYIDKAFGSLMTETIKESDVKTIGS